MIDTNINTEDFGKIQDNFKKYVPNSLKSHVCDDIVYIMTYPSVKVIVGRQVIITDVINDIRTKSERKNVKNKRELSVAYFSANQISGRKENENVTQHSGLIICDIDLDDNPNIDFVLLKKDLCNDKFTHACFNSPSGGIKVIVNTNLTKLEHHKAYFESVKGYFLNNYNITKIDPSGCNIARACYLPYDSQCYYNPNSYRFCLSDTQIESSITKIRIIKQLNNLSNVTLQIGSISNEEHYNNILNLLKKWTEVGIYKNVFNKYRYYNIERGVMDTSVPFLELIILQNSYPYKLNWNTTIDGYYFKSNPQKQLNVIDIGCHEGLEVSKIGFKEDYIIREHYRAKTLGSISMKLIFNNPFCHPERLLQVMIWINDKYCEDPNALNPKPDDEEVRNIVMGNYSKFLDGELDFSKVIEKKKNRVARKFVFRSKEYIAIDHSITHLEACRTFRKGKMDLLMVNLQEAISGLQDGKRITKKRIAEYLGISTKTVGRHMTDDIENSIKNYNKSLKSKFL